MPPTLGVQFSAAADGRQVIADADCVLTSLHTGAASKVGVLSRDKNTTIANSVTAPSNINDDNIIAIAAGFAVPLTYELSAGQSVFVSCSAAATVVLTFQNLQI